MALSVGTVTVSSGKTDQANFILNSTFTADTSYPNTAGGYDMDALLDVKGKAKDFEIVHLTMEPFYDTGGAVGYFAVWQKATNRLRIYDQATGAEVANGTDISAIIDAILVIWAE